MPWGPHRQGGFVDVGHVWFVGDRSPLARHPREQVNDS